ncbi:L-rhamnose mutarotase [Draconibacterium orientale]|uniref:L-rhamnose mutarotase n=1 Tax=Draconibacterium orientale TaxID=1168034 RepID=A0A1I0B9Z8_9BACT|nr:L-rhamnose mutarotase [Draconibacterium orientale]SET03242.1 L-rhamnose mutarotase [Draconibacterium orientale]
MKYKRYCKTMMLKDDPQLIEEYKKVHAKGNTWPKISQGMKEVGIIDMEIYRLNNRLFMIMDTTPDFDHDKAMTELAGKPRQAEWEAFVSRFQVSGEKATANDKWQLMERIYELDQKNEYDAIDGQFKEIE